MRCKNVICASFYWPRCNMPMRIHAKIPPTSGRKDMAMMKKTPGQWKGFWRGSLATRKTIDSINLLNSLIALFPLGFFLEENNVGTSTLKFSTLSVSDEHFTKPSSNQTIEVRWARHLLHKTACLPQTILGSIDCVILKKELSIHGGIRKPWYSSSFMHFQLGNSSAGSDLHEVFMESSCQGCRFWCRLCMYPAKRRGKDGNFSIS